MILIGLAIAALASVAAPDSSAPAIEEPRPYISGFCAPLTLGESDPAALRRVFKVWEAKSSTAAAAQSFQPQDAEIAGQMVEFAAADAPHAFVDRRRGTCSLVYPGTKTPAAVLDELKTRRLPIGPEGSAPTPWRAVVTSRVGPPGPIRYFIPVVETRGVGLCTTVFEDLRLKDNSPAVLVRVSPCRLDPDDTLE